MGECKSNGEQVKQKYKYSKGSLSVYWCGRSGFRSMTPHCCYWVLGFIHRLDPWLFRNHLYWIHQQPEEFTSKYDSNGGDETVTFPMFLVDTFCNNDCGPYNNELRSNYSLKKDSNMHSRRIRFFSESQTIEDFGRELRLQRADVEHLRRLDSLCCTIKEPSVQFTKIHGWSCSVERGKRHNKVQKYYKSYQVKVDE